MTVFSHDYIMEIINIHFFRVCFDNFMEEI